MKTEIVNDTKTVFGNNLEVNYHMSKKDNVIDFIANMSREWEKNHTLIILDEDILVKMFEEAYDYDITKEGVCEVYLDPLKENVISIKKDIGFKKYMIDSVIIGDYLYGVTPNKTFASNVNLISNRVQTKSR